MCVHRCQYLWEDPAWVLLLSSVSLHHVSRDRVSHRTRSLPFLLNWMVSETSLSIFFGYPGAALGGRVRGLHHSSQFYEPFGNLNSGSCASVSGTLFSKPSPWPSFLVAPHHPGSMALFWDSFPIVSETVILAYLLSSLPLTRSFSVCTPKHKQFELPVSNLVMT